MASSFHCAKNKKIQASPCATCPLKKMCATPPLPGLKAAQKGLKAEGPSLVTIRDVPIVMAGVEYQLSTGPATFTPEDIQDFVTSQDDPAIVPPRVQIGHSEYNDAGDLIWPKNAWPALGKFTDIRFDEDNILAIGDAVGVPRWLAEIMPIAYPNRSIEGFQEATTNSGHTWGLVVHAVALLGVVWPGVSTLEDLPLLFSEEGPSDVQVFDSEGEEVDVKAVAASRRRPAPVAAAVNVEDVRRAYYDELGPDQYWWWIRAIYLDPNELIVQDDDSGDLYRVPFTISGEEVAFSDAVQVRIEYVDAASENVRRAMTLAASGGRLMAAFDSRAESRPESSQPREGENMTPEQLRAAIGLPANATQEQVNARLTEINAAAEEQPEEPGAEPQGDPPQGDPAPASESGEEPDEEGEEEEEGGEGEGEPGQPATPPAQAAALPDGMVAVPASEWERVQQGAQAGSRLEASAEDERRDGTINAALGDGRIRPADVTSYRNMHAAGGTSRDVFYQLLTRDPSEGGLAPGLVPTSERGELPAGDGAGSAANAAVYDESWLNPQERARIASVKDGTYQPPRTQTDDPRHLSQNGAGR